MFLLDLALRAIIVPGLICGSLIWGLPRLPRPLGLTNSFSGAAALAVAYLVGHFFAIGLPPLPPLETTQWLFPLALFSLAPAWLIASRPVTLHASAAGLFAMLLIVTLRPMFRYHWTVLESALWMVALLALMGGFWWWLRSSQRDFSGQVTGLSVTLLVAVAAAVVFGLSATALLAQLSMTLAAGLAVLLIYSWWRVPLGGGWLPVALALHFGLVLNALFYAQLALPRAALLLAALLPVGLHGRIPLASRPAWYRVSIVVILALIVSVVAAGGAILEFASEPDYYDY